MLQAISVISTAVMVCFMIVYIGYTESQKKKLDEIVADYKNLAAWLGNEVDDSKQTLVNIANVISNAERPKRRVLGILQEFQKRERARIDKYKRENN